MGAWGYEPFENDAACDFIYEVFNIKLLKKIINKKKLIQDDYILLIASSDLIIRMNKILFLDHSDLIEIKNKLKKILKDKEYINSWDDELKIKNTINKQIKKISIIINNNENHFKKLKFI